MPDSAPQRKVSAAALRRSTLDKLKNEANRRRRPVDELRREYIFQRFLARVFHDPGGPWVLKGGGGLLTRLPGARFSEDLDLLHPEQALAEAIAELRELAKLDLGDQLRWVVGNPEVSENGKAAKLKITANMGVTYFGEFFLDLTTEPRFVDRLERKQPAPVLVVPGTEPLPLFTLYPLADQVADKVCAMYTLYGQYQLAPSTRYRDLVDLALVTTTFPLDAAVTLKALRSEEGRRQITLPVGLHSPGPEWPQGYRDIARDTQLPKALHDLDAALEAVGTCLNPLLAGTVARGSWEPGSREWVSASE